MNINRHNIIMATLATLLTAACGTRNGHVTDTEEVKTVERLPGDSMVYGLACDGCNDTILVLLPLTGEDPDTFDILDATTAGSVFGRPAIGDNVAIITNGEDRRVADLVVDIEQLKGEWCYQLKTLEFGMEIKSEHIVRPIGMSQFRNSEKRDSMNIPPQKRYREWNLLNGRLLLSETRRDTAGVTTTTNVDTAQFVLLQPDSLILRFNDGTERNYYRGKR